jgi:hypothetical protein
MIVTRHPGAPPVEGVPTIRTDVRQVFPTPDGCEREMLDNHLFNPTYTDALDLYYTR